MKFGKIQVNTLSLGTINIPILDDLGRTKDEADQAKANFASLIPPGRMGTLDEIATVTLSLASDDSRFAKGMELFVEHRATQI